MTLEEAVRERAFYDELTKWAQENIVGEHVTRELAGSMPGLMSVAMPVAGILGAMGSRPPYFYQKPSSTWRALQERRRTSGLEMPG